MKMKLKNYKNRTGLVSKKQAGLSMIELLVSTVIGVFLIAGVITNFIGTKDSERVRASMSEMDANARVAMEALRQTISHAGYSSIVDFGAAKEAFYSGSSDTLVDAQCRDSASDKVFKGSTFNAIKNHQKTDDGAGGASDQITVVYMADNPCKPGKEGGPAECHKTGANKNALNDKEGKLVYYDCIGGGADKKALSVSCSTDPFTGMYEPSKAKIYSAFYLEKVTKKKETSTSLYCLGSRAGEKRELVENVENMQIRYGVTDTTGTRYLNATAVENEKAWGNISRVQIALLMRSSIKNVLRQKTKSFNNTDTLSSEKDTFTYDLLGETITIDNKDRRLFRVYTSTINLANSSNQSGPIR